MFSFNGFLPIRLICPIRNPPRYQHFSFNLFRSWYPYSFVKHRQLSLQNYRYNHKSNFNNGQYGLRRV